MTQVSGRSSQMDGNNPISPPDLLCVLGELTQALQISVFSALKRMVKSDLPVYPDGVR